MSSESSRSSSDAQVTLGPQGLTCIHPTYLNYGLDATSEPSSYTLEEYIGVSTSQPFSALEQRWGSWIYLS